MPDNPVLIYHKESGTPAYMHSIDAAEALSLGDYTATPPATAPPPEDLAAAKAAFQGSNPNMHPEQMSEDARTALRAEATAEAQAETPPEEPLGVRRALGATSPLPAPSEHGASRPSRRGGRD